MDGSIPWEQILMRFLVLSLCLAAVLAAVPAVDAAAKTHDVSITATGFAPQEVIIHPGDVVRWTLDSGIGKVIVKNGNIQDEETGTIFSFELNAEKTEHSETFSETGTYHYFASESMDGTITVKEATPVDVKTWGWLKTAFETSGAPRPRR
jgi:plastocyanin